MLTNGYHTLSIVVQILQYHLAQCVYLAPCPNPNHTYAFVHASRSCVAIFVPHTHLLFAQEAALFFQPTQQAPKLSHHFTIAGPILFTLANHNGEVEDEFVPTISALSYADRIANHTVMIDAESEQAIAKLLGRYEVLRDRRKGKERRRESRRKSGRGYAARGDLVQDAVACR